MQRRPSLFRQRVKQEARVGRRIVQPVYLVELPVFIDANGEDNQLALLVEDTLAVEIDEQVLDAVADRVVGRDLNVVLALLQRNVEEFSRTTTNSSAKIRR